MYRVQYRECYGDLWKIKEGLFTLEQACKIVCSLLDVGMKAQYSFVAHQVMRVNRRVA